MRFKVTKDLIVRSARFAMVGVFGTLIYFGLALALLSYDLPLIAAHSIAYVASILASYLGQKIFTFQIRGQHRRNAPRFIVANVMLAVVQFAIVAVMQVMGVDDQFVVVFVTLTYPPASFLLHNLWTFKKPASAK